MGRSIFAVLAGALAAMVVIVLVEMLGLRVFPLPAGVDPTDTTALAAALSTAPIGALLFVMAAWLLGAGVGAMTALRVARSPERWPGLAVGGLVLAGALYNLWTLPHPMWFAGAAVVGIIVVTLMASRASPPASKAGA
jgi:hypothetical protein